MYRYFGDKRDLFGLVVTRVLREWHETLAAAAARPTPATAHTLRLVLRACLAFARDRTVLRGLLIRDAGLVRSQIGTVLDEGRSQLPRLLHEVLAQDVRRRDVRADLVLEDLAHVVSEVFISYTLLVLAGADDQVTDRRVDAVIETLLHGVIVPVRAEPGHEGRRENR